MANKPLTTMITIGGTVTAGLKSALGSTASMVAGIGKAVDDLNRRHTNLKLIIDKFESMGKSADALRLSYWKNTLAIRDMVAAQGKLELSQKRKADIKAHATNIGAAGAGASKGGKAILDSIIPGVSEAKKYDGVVSHLAALGMNPASIERAKKFALQMEQFGLSQVDKLELMRDAMALFGNQDDAEKIMPVLGRMKVGNMTVFGKESAEANAAVIKGMIKFIQMRGGLNSPAEFEKQADFVQRQYSATRGEVDPGELSDFSKQSSVIGATIEGEALVSMGTLVKTLGGAQAGAGLSAVYNSLYQGTMQARQFENIESLGLIGDRSKVGKSGKSPMMVRMNPGALLGSDLFAKDPFAWMNQVLLPQLDKNGIKDDAKIKESFAMIAGDASGAGFLTAMYNDRKNIEAKRKTLPKAFDTKQVEAEGKASTEGKEAEATAKLSDSKRLVGNEVIPLYTKALILASNALDKLNKFSERNPELTSTLVIGITALGVGLATVGPLLVTAAGAMGIYAAAQTMLTRVAIGGPVGGAATEGAGMLGRALAGLRTIVPGVLAVLRPLALAFMIAGAPMGLLVAGALAIAAAGVLIWKYWEPLKAFFSSFGSALVAGLAPVGQGILAAFGPVWDVLKPIVMPVLEGIGTFVGKIVTWFGELLTPVSATAQLTTDFGNAGKVCGDVVARAFNAMLLPINTVFMCIKWISENIGWVIEKTSQLGPGGIFRGGWDMAKALFNGPAPAMAGGAPALPPVRGAGPAVGVSSSPVNTININQQPWQDPRAVADEIMRLLQRQQSIDGRSSLRDYTQ